MDYQPEGIDPHENQAKQLEHEIKAMFVKQTQVICWFVHHSEGLEVKLNLIHLQPVKITQSFQQYQNSHGISWMVYQLHQANFHGW